MPTTEDMTTVHQSGIDVRVRDILQGMMTGTNFALDQHKRGIDTELAQFVKRLVEDRHNTLMTFFAAESERYSKLFVVVFMKAIENNQLNDLVDHYAVDIRALNVYLWVILKEQDAAFEQCSKFYDAHSNIMQDPIFQKLRVEFSVFSADEAPTPGSFERIAP